MSEKKDDDQPPDDEIARRMERGIRRLLNTPPQPQKEMVGKTGRAKSPRSRKPPKSAPEDR
jgi:hypothetical protein